MAVAITDSTSKEIEIYPLLSFFLSRENITGKKGGLERMSEEGFLSKRPLTLTQKS